MAYFDVEPFKVIECDITQILTVVRQSLTIVLSGDENKIRSKAKKGILKEVKQDLCTVEKL
eukprot:Pgem_evm1s17929